MKKQPIKTDNTHLGEKIRIRVEALKNIDNIIVLDAFHGEGKIWRKVLNKVNSDIQVIGIDKKSLKGVMFVGDNIKYLRNLDLGAYNVIDLDSYGIPFPQLEVIFNNSSLKKGTIIIYTFIQTMYGCLHRRMLYSLGYTKKMIDKIPTIFNRNGFKKFNDYLSLKGIKRTKYIDINEKKYGYFMV